MNMTTESISTVELEELGRFVGQWKTEGKIPATETTPEVTVFGTDTYEWLPGEYFLLHKVNVLIGSDKNETFEVIGFSKQIGKYTMQHYDNKGNSGFMTATCENGIWTYFGDTLKFTGGFNKEGNVFSGVWEQTRDHKTWIHFMDITLTREEQ